MRLVQLAAVDLAQVTPGSNAPTIVGILVLRVAGVMLGARHVGLVARDPATTGEQIATMLTAAGVLVLGRNARTGVRVTRTTGTTLGTLRVVAEHEDAPSIGLRRRLPRGIKTVGVANHRAWAWG
jgi:hypothetical protein